MAQIGRLLTAMVTPFTVDGSRIDYGQAQRLAQALLSSGSDGLVVSGTTGEAPTLSSEEKISLVQAVKEASGDDTVIAGTSTYNTRESVELSREAARAGADALLLTSPYYNRPTQEGLYQHFAAIAAAVDIPCILYNIPGRSGVNINPETALRLAQVPNIVGVKEASGNLEQAARIIGGAPDGFWVWSGNDGDTIPLMAIGAHGVISVASHLVGTQMQEMMEHLLTGHIDEAARIHRRLLPLIAALFLVSNPIPIKCALNQAGFHVGPPRLPLCEADEATAQKIRAELAHHRIDLPVPA